MRGETSGRESVLTPLRVRVRAVTPLVLLTLMTGAWGAAPILPEPRMTYLENDELRIGMDLNLGGAVTFLGAKARPGNLINSADLGRQIQMSHYSGPWPFTVGDKKPHPTWAGLGWNPIQTGDCYGNPSTVLEHRNDGREIYIRCRPMQWPLNNVPGDCLFETWTQLEGPLVRMRFRCTNRREDKTAYRPCPQELPAVYTISKLSRLMAYTGEEPFTGAALTHLRNDWRQGWPWVRFTATERWAALVGEDDWGLGVFKDDGGEFHGGIHGDARSADPKHGSTAYVAPIHRENFDHNIVFEHETVLMVGGLDAIRRRFNALATKNPPQWRFMENRQHWVLLNARDEGFPLNGEWRVHFGKAIPRLESPLQCWRAEEAPSVELKIAYRGQASTARLFWKRLADDHFDLANSLTWDLVPDGEFHTYYLDLASAPTYRGLIAGLAIEPVSKPRPGEELAIRSILLGDHHPVVAPFPR